MPLILLAGRSLWLRFMEDQTRLFSDVLSSSDCSVPPKKTNFKGLFGCHTMSLYQSR